MQYYTNCWTDGTIRPQYPTPRDVNLHGNRVRHYVRHVPTPYELLRQVTLGDQPLTGQQQRDEINASSVPFTMLRAAVIYFTPPPQGIPWVIRDCAWSFVYLNSEYTVIVVNIEDRMAWIEEQKANGVKFFWINRNHEHDPWTYKYTPKRNLKELREQAMKDIILDFQSGRTPGDMEHSYVYSIGSITSFYQQWKKGVLNFESS